jgi:hypothetical protein
MARISHSGINQLTWSTLLSPHNEHRIFFSRLWALGLYAINHQWDARLQTAANAFLHTFFALWLAWSLWRLNERKNLNIILALFVLVLAVPFSWENTLFGFQSSFYFLLGFSSMTLLLIPQNRPFTLPWITGVFFALLSLLTMGSGFFAVLTCPILIGINSYLKRQLTRYDVINLISCLLILVAGIALIQVQEGHARFQPETFLDFIKALSKNLSWPWVDIPFLFPILWCPFVILCYRVCFFSKETSLQYPLFIIGLGLWVLMQCTAIAYARGNSQIELAPRYMDLLSLIPVVNILSAHHLYNRLTENRKKRTLINIACTCWYALPVIGIIYLLINNSIQGFTNMGSLLAKQSETIGRYLTTNDDKIILEARHMEIPYPDAKKLSLLLQNDAIRDLLPVSVRQPLAVVPSKNDQNGFTQNGYFSAMSGMKDRVAWGSYDPVKRDQHTGFFKSGEIASPRLPFLRFNIAGYLDNSRLKLELYDMSNRVLGAVAPKGLPKESWKSVDIRSPKIPFFIKATDQSADHQGWFAFTEPVEIGYFSIIADSILSIGWLLFVSGFAFMLLTIIYGHLQKTKMIQ